MSQNTNEPALAHLTTGDGGCQVQAEQEAGNGR